MSFLVGPNDYPVAFTALTAAEVRCYGGGLLADQALRLLDKGHTQMLRKVFVNALAKREKMRLVRIFGGDDGQILGLMDGIDPRHLEVADLRAVIASPKMPAKLKTGASKMLATLLANLEAELPDAAAGVEALRHCHKIEVQE